MIQPDNESSRHFLEFSHSGNAAALELALVPHINRAVAQAKWILGNADDAEDAVQNALVILVRTAPRYDGSVSFRAWLAQLVHGSAISLYRSRRQRRSRERRITALTGANSDDVTCEIVREEVARLPKRYRLPLDLHYFAGLSLEETASAMGVNAKAANKRMERARERLEMRLRRHGITTASIAALAALFEARSHAGAIVSATSTLTANALKTAAMPISGHGISMAAAGLFLASLAGIGGIYVLSGARHRPDPMPRLESIDGSRIAIDVTQLVPDGGNAFWIWQSVPMGADSVDDNAVSSLRVFEDGRELGPAHALHRDIRELGNGRFSHWGEGLRCGLLFSSSDNSDPRTNGRTYYYLAVDSDRKGF